MTRCRIGDTSKCNMRMVKAGKRLRMQSVWRHLSAYGHASHKVMRQSRTSVYGKTYRERSVMVIVTNYDAYRLSQQNFEQWKEQ